MAKYDKSYHTGSQMQATTAIGIPLSEWKTVTGMFLTCGKFYLSNKVISQNYSGLRINYPQKTLSNVLLGTIEGWAPGLGA